MPTAAPMPAQIAAMSHGLWGHSAAPAPETQPLQRDIAVDVAVVGAGFTGLSTALHLREEGAAGVAVLEAADIGFGASGRNVGLVNAGAWIPPDELPRRLGQTYGRRLLQTLGAGPDLVFDIIGRHRIDCAAVRHGNLHCALGAGGLANIRERARQWTAHGVAVRLIDAAETARLVGSDVYSGALLDPRTGTIEPLGYVRGLARAAIASGAAVYTQTAVTGARADGALWRLSTARGHSVTARQVVVATNTAQSLAPDAWPQLQQELARLPYFNVATEPLPPASRQKILPGGHGVWDTATILSSWRLDAGGRLVCGSVGALTPGARNAHLQWARRAIARQFPALGGIAIEHQWYGWIDTTAHHLPHLHRLAGNVWSLSGYNGRGIAPGTILGRELAWMLRGKIQPQDMSLPVTALGPIRFKRLRETFYQSGAAAAHAVGQRW
ncbi:NAD(P)/FAD-dependent oxidoreductase [Verminephrobacter eiseniae]|uniref:FAD dependent oxidoreductase n=1 Tax=Verminephrobacter eiseniae (strain EF01-2) TaxID=391735 RepID=A1WRB0_VEREI|nr:FAD-binding oxidoreductase [Verminephrobacter eiseniae]ABM60167.1 FAD dependent oxidoreductase [Verminephrobacter eiseniae EF01-2]